MKSICLGIALAAMVAAPALAADPILPDQNLTPGAVDSTVTAPDICRKVWLRGSPPKKGGTQTYSQAARHTSSATKQKAFAEYGVPKANRNGTNYEIDHRLPLSLGGRDVLANLWPETRQHDVAMNAWDKDRLEFKVYNMLCPRQGEATISLQDAQAAFLGDWTEAYVKYCPTAGECQPYGDD